jgi:hypothetical protein
MSTNRRYMPPGILSANILPPYVDADDGLRKDFNERDFRPEADYGLGDIDRQWGKSMTDHKSYSSVWIETLIVRRHHRRRRWDGRHSNAGRWARYGLSTWIKFCAIEGNKVIGKGRLDYTVIVRMRRTHPFVGLY